MSISILLRDLNKIILKSKELNELANWDLMLSINTNSSVRKVAFGLVRNAKSLEFKIAWDRLINKYALYTALALLKLKSKFHVSKLMSIEKDPDEWIANLEGFQI